MEGELLRSAFTAGQGGVAARVGDRWQRFLIGSSLHSMALKGKHPLRLMAAPSDPWPGITARGAQILAGTLEYAGHVTPCRHVDAWSLSADAPGAHRRALHTFRWLRDLAKVADQDRARAVAERMMRDWLGHYGHWDDYSWQPDILGERLAFWAMHAPLILSSSDHVYRSLVLNRMGRQARHLAWVLKKGRSAHGRERISALTGLIVAGAVLPGHEHLARTALLDLEETLSSFVLADGGVASRSAEDALRTLLFLDLLKKVLPHLGADCPPFLEAAVKRLTPAIETMRMGDGGFATMGGTFADRKEDIDLLLGTANRASPLPRLHETGYERLSAKRVVVIMDAGPPPGDGLMADAQAGTLSFEMSDGGSRMIVNMGGTADGWGGSQGELSEFARATAAHSTLVIDDTNSTEINAVGRLGSGVSRTRVVRQAVNEGELVIASHDGYVSRFGLTHGRRLWLDREGTELAGEDILEPCGPWWRRLFCRRPKTVQLRFHLHPTVTATPTRAESAVLLRLDNGKGWIFRVDGGRIDLEESVYTARPGKVRRTVQVVVSMQGARAGTRLNWSIHRADAG